MYTITPLLSSDLVSTSRVTINNNFSGLATDIIALSAAGASGYSGYSGVGISGYSGQAGASGYSGYSGLNGANAASGYSGAVGVSGYSGITGASGYSGSTGADGASGYSGTAGTSGYSGQTGTSGYSGAAGASGYSGQTGTSGYSGLSYPSTTGSWTLSPGANTVSFTVTNGYTYSMWVNGNISNGICVWNATATVTNNNVPVIGSQYAWYYTGGSNLVFTSIPAQIIGTEGAISTSLPSVGTTTNVFTFGITNNSETSQVVNWGYNRL